MVKVIIENLSQYKIDEYGECPLQAYGEIVGEDKIIHLDKDANTEKQRLDAIHEVIELNLPQVAHKKIDQVAIEIIEALEQL